MAFLLSLRRFLSSSRKEERKRQRLWLFGVSLVRCVCMSRKSAALEGVWRAGVPYDFFEAMECEPVQAIDL